jgi:hypothetical protein
MPGATGTKRRRKRVLREQRRHDARRETMRRQAGALVRQPPWDELPPDEPDGGAGVREPRRPFPNAPAGAMELDLPQQTGRV